MLIFCGVKCCFQTLNPDSNPKITPTREQDQVCAFIRFKIAGATSESNPLTPSNAGIAICMNALLGECRGVPHTWLAQRKLPLSQFSISNYGAYLTLGRVCI